MPIGHYWQNYGSFFPLKLYNGLSSHQLPALQFDLHDRIGCDGALADGKAIVGFKKKLASIFAYIIIERYTFSRMYFSLGSKK